MLLFRFLFLFFFTLQREPLFYMEHGYDDDDDDDDDDENDDDDNIKNNNSNNNNNNNNNNNKNNTWRVGIPMENELDIDPIKQAQEIIFSRKVQMIKNPLIFQSKCRSANLF